MAEASDPMVGGAGEGGYLQHFSHLYYCKDCIQQSGLTALCTYQCYAPLPPVRAIVRQSGDLTK